MVSQKITIASATLFAGLAASPALAQVPKPQPETAGMECLSADKTALKPGPYAGFLKKAANATPREMTWSGLDGQLRRSGVRVQDYCVAPLGKGGTAFVKADGGYRLVFNNVGVADDGGIDVVVPLTPDFMAENFDTMLENGLVATARSGVVGDADPLVKASDDIHSMVAASLAEKANMDAEMLLHRLHAYLQKPSPADLEALHKTPYPAEVETFMARAKAHAPTMLQKDTLRHDIMAEYLTNSRQIAHAYGEIVTAIEILHEKTPQTAIPTARPDDKSFAQRFSRFGKVAEGIDFPSLRADYEKHFGETVTKFQQMIRAKLQPPAPAPII